MKQIILAGNPNTGKSVIFNYLTKQYVTVSNYPGTTVDISKGVGRFFGRDFTVVDTPGINSLLPNSEDEAVTRKLILRQKPESIIQVADSKLLKRSLNLTQELADLGVPIILTLNMSDEARERGIKINSKIIADAFGVNVVEAVATTREGLGLLAKNIFAAEGLPFMTTFDKKIESSVNEISEILPKNAGFRRFISIAAISGDEEILNIINLPEDKIERIKNKISLLQREYPSVLRLIIQAARDKRSAQVVAKAVSLQGPVLKKSWQNLLGQICLRPVTAIPMAIFLIYLMYKFIGQFAAGTVVDFMEEKFFAGFIIPMLNNFSSFINLPFWARDFLLGDYGVISVALTYALAIIFPIVTAFFIFFGFMEDSGYLPRLCVLLDRLFHPIGLNGKAVLPFVLGLGCGTMATLTTRTLDTRKERIIATLILALAVPCSAQLGVIMGMLSGMSAKATIIWLIVIISSGFAVGLVVSKMLPGGRSILIQEIPPIRMPQVSNILAKTWMRLKWYLKEAVPLFILGTVILFALEKSGLLRLIEKIASPLVTGLLNLPHKATEAFLIGFLRRDYGAAGLYVMRKNGGLDNIQAVVSLVVITLFVPCIAQFFVTIKERGAKTAAAIISFTFAYAFIAGGLLNFTLRALKINF